MGHSEERKRAPRTPGEQAAFDCDHFRDPHEKACIKCVDAVVLREEARAEDRGRKIGLARAAEIARAEFADRRLWDETCRVVANEIAAAIEAEARKA